MKFIKEDHLITCMGSVTKAMLRLANATAGNTNEVLGKVTCSLIHVLGDEEMDDGMKEMDDHTGFPELLTKPHSKKD
uniref:Uncharacterized protein n=1 Tax=Oncorhynchus kisutch TaxID=8019 RepID=A0A8C7CQG0_ONCKI